MCTRGSTEVITANNGAFIANMGARVGSRWLAGDVAAAIEAASLCRTEWCTFCAMIMQRTPVLGYGMHQHTTGRYLGPCADAGWADPPRTVLRLSPHLPLIPRCSL